MMTCCFILSLLLVLLLFTLDTPLCLCACARMTSLRPDSDGQVAAAGDEEVAGLVEQAALNSVLVTNQ